ncbi:hypothetical protein OG259_03980 [Streptomyces sp. NBC_00250]|uniref:hypothetical protein n=1 Tax=Streptomyces sp. NBC_00250 TaxID=2903641 RepID=UPI002E2A4B5E|nr:hypothetical protein [Streptomyces sp. NBC_00250]
MSNPTQPEPPALAAATAMFVEVLVVGIGTLTAAVLLLIALVGPVTASKLAPAVDSSLVAGAALAAAYALGILIDRVADAILTPQRRLLRTQHFPSQNAYAQARLRLVDHPAQAARADYTRSRMRICRGWFLNSMALTLTADLTMLRYSFAHRPLVLCAATLLGAVTAFGFHRAWRSLTETGYRKLAQQAALTTGSAVPSQPQAGTTLP